MELDPCSGGYYEQNISSMHSHKHINVTSHSYFPAVVCRNSGGREESQSELQGLRQDKMITSYLNDSFHCEELV